MSNIKHGRPTAREFAARALWRALNAGNVTNYIAHLEEVCWRHTDLHAAAELAGFFFLYSEQRFVRADEFVAIVEDEVRLGIANSWDVKRLDDARKRADWIKEGYDE